jgi:hypothetical protein
MEDVLDVYAEPVDPLRPRVCLDESPFQLIGEVRTPIAAKPGQIARFDSEYSRKGTANLFIRYDIDKGQRHVKVTDHRAAVDFAEFVRELVDDEEYKNAEKIRVVMDNLSTHSEAALYEAFPPEEARRLLHRLEFHFTPKHASWLNMVEIEIGVLRCQCLDRRIGERSLLESEIKAWEQQRNAEAARINWMFTVEKARVKMGQAYPTPRAVESPAAEPVMEATAPVDSTSEQPT